MIRPVDTGLVEGLVMQQLLYAGEVRSISDIDIPKMDVKPAELKLAQQSSSIGREVRSERLYRRSSRARRAAVQKKVEGQEITMAEAPSGARVIDLMEALRASLEKKPAKKAAPPLRSPARRAEGRQEIACTSSGCGRWKSSCACRAARFALVEAGFVTPGRGPRNSLRFSFQDLIVLRTAQALAAAGAGAAHHALAERAAAQPRPRPCRFPA